MTTCSEDFRRPECRRSGGIVRPRPLFPGLLGAFIVAGSQLMLASQSEKPSAPTPGRVFFVRQTVGSDVNDGLSPATAWKTISRLAERLQAGDSVYIGPGLYRENVVPRNPATAEKRIRFIADAEGRLTGDPPGAVMITGADPFDETLFKREKAAVVYRAPSLGSHVLGVVEMDGPQLRYTNATDTREYGVNGKSALEVVAAMPSSFHYDGEAAVFYIHTSDGRPPSEHEIEIIRRNNGIVMNSKPYVTVVGFTFRHMSDAGLAFWDGSDGGIAMNNVSWGGRQGIRVYASKDVLIHGNTLFRNDNSGVYFAKQSTHGYAIANITYENVKGVRWSSDSNFGLALNNHAFENREAGIAIEDVQGTRLAGNQVTGNPAQLLTYKSEYEADGNCFETKGDGQLVALVEYGYKFSQLSDYQKARQKDLSSRHGACQKKDRIDVRLLHGETMRYLERALKDLDRTGRTD